MKQKSRSWICDTLKAHNLNSNYHYTPDNPEYTKLIKEYQEAKIYNQINKAKGVEETTNIFDYNYNWYY